jgi:hypothetical protein
MFWSAFLMLWQNTPEKQLKRWKDLFLLTVSEVSIHGHLAHLLLGLWWGSISWWEHMVEKSCLPHGGQKGGGGERERERERDWGRLNISYKGMPTRTYFNTSTRSHLLMSPWPPYMPSAGDQALNSWILGNNSDPNYDFPESCLNILEI